MTMADNAVTLVAVLPARPLASLTELVTTAAGAGATGLRLDAVAPRTRPRALEVAEGFGASPWSSAESN